MENVRTTHIASAIQVGRGIIARIQTALEFPTVVTAVHACYLLEPLRQYACVTKVSMDLVARTLFAQVSLCAAIEVTVH